MLEGFYGDDPEVLSERAGALSRVLGEFARQFGSEREVVLVRSPGRINLMGRHIDWQGGRCNLMAVTQEVVMVAGPRNDDHIEARNVAADQFPDARITLGEMVSRLAWDDWMSVVDSGELHRHLREQEGHWRLYIEAAMLRLQMAFRTRALQGMDLAVLGNIPPAAGMSSSSALVVATAEAAVSLNNLDVSPQQFVNFCGEGEWFVGTRGGSADHAAMKLGRKGTVNHVEFHDFRLIERLELPSTHKLVVANSLVLAKKAVGARATFNARVGSYLVGLELIRARFPRQAPFIRLIRDLNPEALGLNASWIYQVLLELPVAVTARWVRERFQGDGEAWTRLAPHFAQAAGDNEYPVRGVVMFGVAECARSRQAAELLRQGDLPGVGELMRISHDGERCFRTRGPGPAQPFAVDISDAALRQLVEDLASGDPVRQTNARLERQPGAYRASTEEVDTLVDLANAVPGVLGAQIAGAGLGGCAMILAENDAVSALCDRLHREYYDARGLPRSVLVCRASAGSGLIDIPSPKTTSD
ncbi:MAG: galactokinase [Planctomycetaceae bacterium]